ncbi:MAG TPA: glycosyltransferase [Pirellulales bacterium]|nr:glycosyltransferase [Pirellulales bacterium]
MRASIVVASHQEGERLWRTIESCVETTIGLEREIVVADDASFDGSVEEAIRRFPQVRLFRHEERLGASPSKALGARHARGDTLVFLDGHCNPECGAIERLIDDVEQVKGQAIVTPAIPALDVPSWKNAESQIGHGYFLDLEEFHCGWLPLGELRGVWRGPRKFYESPALIGCALAVGHELYDKLGGFDPHMRCWGVEDLDFGLKSWLMGFPILHDPEAAIGHRFRAAFENFSVPMEHLLANQLRMARKNFTDATWSDWVERCRSRHVGRLPDHPEGLWTLAWEVFQADRRSADHERAMLLGHRHHDEFWYAERFGLEWPRLATTASVTVPRLFSAQPSPSPSPSPPPCEVTGVTPATKTLCVGVSQTFTAQGTNLKNITWSTGGAGTPDTGKGSTFSTKFNQPGVYTVTAKCGKSSASATVTAVSITFAPNPVRTGMIKPLPANKCNIQNISISTTVVATVRPSSAVGSVTISLSGADRATLLGQPVVNPQQGTITVRLTGTAMTPKRVADTFLQASLGSKVCSKVPVFVIVPYKVVPVSAAPTVVNGTNKNLTACTKPAYTWSLKSGFVYLASVYGITQTVQVLDQFNAPLDRMYNGAPVFENVGKGWFPINVTVNGASYPDPVGQFFPGAQNPKVDANSTAAQQWPGRVRCQPTPRRPMSRIFSSKSRASPSMSAL